MSRFASDFQFQTLFRFVTVQNSLVGITICKCESKFYWNRTETIRLDFFFVSQIQIESIFTVNFFYYNQIIVCIFKCGHISNSNCFSFYFQTQSIQFQDKTFLIFFIFLCEEQLRYVNNVHKRTNNTIFFQNVCSFYFISFGIFAAFIWAWNDWLLQLTRFCICLRKLWRIRISHWELDHRIYFISESKQRVRWKWFRYHLFW